MSRAKRRHHRARMVERAKKVQRRWWYGDHTEEQLQQAACRLADNLQACSCSGCGNPRRHHGFPRLRRGMGFRNQALTMQERRAAESHLDQIEELLAKEADLDEGSR